MLIVLLPHSPLPHTHTKSTRTLCPVLLFFSLVHFPLTYSPSLMLFSLVLLYTPFIHIFLFYSIHSCLFYLFIHISFTLHPLLSRSLSMYLFSLFHPFFAFYSPDSCSLRPVFLSVFSFIHFSIHIPSLILILPCFTPHSYPISLSSSFHHYRLPL